MEISKSTKLNLFHYFNGRLVHWQANQQEVFPQTVETDHHWHWWWFDTKEPASFWHNGNEQSIANCPCLNQERIENIIFFYLWIRRKTAIKLFSVFPVVSLENPNKNRKKSFLIPFFWLHLKHTAFCHIVALGNNKILRCSDFIIFNWKIILISLELYHWLCFLQEDLFWFLMLFIQMKEYVIIFHLEENK